MIYRNRVKEALEQTGFAFGTFVQIASPENAEIAAASGFEVKLGRYVHQADSYHLYGSYFREFEERFMGAIKSRSFEERTYSYAEMKIFMDEAIPAIREKAGRMGQ